MLKVVEDVLLSDGKEHTLLIIEDESRFFVVEVKGEFDMGGSDYEKIISAFYKVTQ